MPRSYSMYQRRSSQGGFTLIELLVVIIILGILAAVVVFAVSGVGDRGRDSARAIDVRTLRTAEEAFCASNGRYTDEAGLVAGGYLSEESSYHRVVTGPGGLCGSSPASKYAVSCPIIVDGCDPSRASVDGGPGGSWKQVADLNSPISMGDDDAVVLGDGRVFVLGANGVNKVTEIYDPRDDSWTAATPRPGPSAVYDPVAITGTPATCGSNCNKVLMRYSGSGFNGWTLFDPAGNGGAGSWQDTNPAVGRRNIFFKAVLINPHGTACGQYCGKVLVIGGNDNLAGAPPVPQQDLWETADMYDPAADGWRTVPDRLVPPGRVNELAVGLPDGRVVVFGGNDPDAVVEPYNLRTMEIYTPATDSWDSGPMSTWDHGSSNSWSGGAATLLGDGRVLVAAGGSTDEDGPAGTVDDSHDKAEVFDPAGNGGAGSWTPAAACACLLGGSTLPHRALAFPYGGTAIVLPLVIFDPMIDNVALFQPATLDWDETAAAFPATRDSGAGVVALPDGRLLVIGGRDETLTLRKSTFMFTPDIP